MQSLFIKQPLTNTEMEIAINMVKSQIEDARKYPFQLGDKLYSITGESYIIIQLSNNQYGLLNAYSGWLCKPTFDTLSELTLLCQFKELIKEN